MRGIITLGLAAALFAAGPVFAHSTGDHACKHVWEACKKAGKKGKDLKACVDSIKGGGTVEGVTVDADVAKNCAADKK
jgi:hypothetical protein